MSTEAAPVPVAPAATPVPAAPAAAAPSPRSPVPPATGTPAAHLEAAKKIFAPDPARTAPTPNEAPKTETPAPKAEATKAPDAAAVTPKAETPAPEVFPEDKLAEPTTETAKAGWKELKALTKAERNRATVLENEIKELRAKQTTAIPTAADTAELDRLKTEHKALSDRLLILDLQNHPDFVRQYKEPVQKSFAESAQLLADNGVTEKIDLNALLSKPRAEFAKQVSELAAKMNAYDGQTFTANMRQAFQLKGQEAEALAKAGDVHTQLQQKAQQAQRQAFESITKEVTTTVAKLEIKPDMSAEDRAAAEAYNQSVDSIRTEAEAKAFGKVTEKDVAEMAYNNALLGHFAKHVVPKLERHVQSQNQVIADLTAQLKALQGGKAPSPGGQAAPAAAPDANMSHEERARAIWRK